MSEGEDRRTLHELRTDPQNRRTHGERNRAMTVEALRALGAARSIVIDEGDTILAGNGVTAAAIDAGITSVRVIESDGTELIAVRRRGLTAEQKRALALYDNRTAELAEWDPAQFKTDLAAGLEFAPFFFDHELRDLLGTDAGAAHTTLAARFGVPPFSVLDARQGYWQTRKRAWLALGIESELGRAEDMLGLSPAAARMGSATLAESSIFDPVLCELIVRWFCPPGGLVLDPFAGGSVRGIVAAQLGRRYLGIDLRAEQIAANVTQAQRLGAAVPPQWIVGDSRQLATLAGDARADLVFTCPPYGDLESYSDDAADLSTLDYPAFIEALGAIMAAAIAQLQPDRFACVVVGDIRDKLGYYRGFVSDTAAACARAGARLYNDAILVTAVGSLPIRAAKYFESARKLGKTHQNVLVFCNGDPRVATEAIGVVDFGTGEDPTEGGA